MHDLVGNELHIGDKVIFSYVRETVAIGQIIKICKQKVRIKHEIIYDRQSNKREETLRYPYEVVKWEVSGCQNGNH